MKALVIDDESMIRTLIVRILQTEGYEVSEAPNGRIGYALFQQHSPDLVITDIIMPDQEGIETIRRLRAVNPQVTIIAMSGGSQSGNIDFLRMAKEFGAAATINKPFRKQDLVALIRQLVNGNGPSPSGDGPETA